MNSRRIQTTIALVTATFAFGGASRMSGATVTVVEDNGVAKVNGTTNVGTDPSLWVGSGTVGFIGDADARFYLKFGLPTSTPGTSISSATLSGFFLSSESPRIDDTFSIYLAASDGWTEYTQTWNNQPGTTGSPLATFSSVGLVNNTRYSWDITAAANTEYLGDGTLSLVFRADNESLGSGLSTKYFASKENIVNQPFRIDYTVVPEPTQTLLFGMGVTALIACRRRTSNGR